MPPGLTGPATRCLQGEGQQAGAAGAKALENLLQHSAGDSLEQHWMEDEDSHGLEGEEGGYDSDADEGSDEEEEPALRVCRGVGDGRM